MNNSYRKFYKRLFDACIAVLAIILLLPLFVGVAILVRYKLGAPVLFCQERPGLNGQPFTMRKFRTMIDARDKESNMLSDSERLTPFGRFLRSTSLDELPELFNVVCGDMSLVGPRPLLMRYLGRYTPEQMRRHELLPGITGWAQVNGRNTISWEKRFELDVWYVDNCSFLLDLKVIFMTILKVSCRQNINQEGEATQSEFTGSVVPKNSA